MGDVPAVSVAGPGREGVTPAVVRGTISTPAIATVMLLALIAALALWGTTAAFQGWAHNRHLKVLRIQQGQMTADQVHRDQITKRLEGE